MCSAVSRLGVARSGRYSHRQRDDNSHLRRPHHAGISLCGSGRQRRRRLGRRRHDNRSDRCVRPPPGSRCLSSLAVA